MTRSDLPHVNCPECGAENNTFANRCWICRRPLYEGDELIEAETVEEAQSPQRNTLGRVFAVWGFVILAFGAVVVGLGVIGDSPAYSVPYLLLVTPLVIAVGVLIFKGNQSENGILRKVSMVVSALLVTAGTLALLGIAVVIALVAFCFMMLASSGH